MTDLIALPKVKLIQRSLESLLNKKSYSPSFALEHKLSGIAHGLRYTKTLL